MYKKNVIEVIIVVIVLIGIVSFTFIDHSGISENRAIGLVKEQVKKEYNVSEYEVNIINMSSNTNNVVEDFFSKLSGQKVYNVNVTVQAENKTHNASYSVNANNGTVSILPKSSPTKRK